MPSAIEFVTHTVSTRASLSAGDWAVQAELICLSLTVGTSPTVPEARLLWRYGIIGAPGSPAAQVAPLDLRGTFVKISATGLPDWIGFVPVDGNARQSWDEATGRGDQQFIAHGLEWFLERTYVTRTNISGRSDAGEVFVERAIGFNVGAGDGRGIEWEKRANRSYEAGADGGDIFFHYINRRHNQSNPPKEWTATQIVRNLLKYNSPRDNSGVASPVRFLFFESSAPYLDWYKPTVKVEGRTLLHILNEVIDRRRGLHWWLTTELIGDEIIAIVEVDSFATADVTMPGGDTLPAAGAITQLAGPDFLEALDGAIVIERDDSRKWHRVVARGARRTSTYSVHYNGTSSPCGLGLENGWDGTLEQPYADGAKLSTGYVGLGTTDKQKRNDRYRQTEKFSRVFRDYLIVQTADNDFGFGSGKHLSPIIIASTGSIVGGQQICIGGARVLRTLATKKGWDYSDATAPVPPPNEDIDTLEDFLAAEHGTPFGLWMVDGMSDLWSDPDSRWLYIDRLGSHENEGDESGPGFNVEITPLAEDYGVSLRTSGAMQHILAGTALEETTPTAEPSRYPWGVGAYLPGLMLFTFTSEWDSWCEGAYPEAIPSQSPLETLYVYLSERLRFDWLCANTCYDLDEMGKLKLVQTQGAIRDDTLKCADIARLAYQWYAEDRAKLTMNFRKTMLPPGVGIGTLITSLNTGATNEEVVNAVVTQITHNLEEGTTSISAGYAELDFAELL